MRTGTSIVFSRIDRSKQFSVCVILFTAFFFFGSGFLRQRSVFLGEQSADSSSFIGDVELRVASVKRITPDSYQAGDIWYGTREPWNSDRTRLMFWEDNNSHNLINGKYGLGVVWARRADLTRWTTLEEYEVIRHTLNIYPYTYDQNIEWSPFVGEENVVYAACLSDLMLVKINIDDGAVEPIISLDPHNGSTIYPSPMRWTLQNTLIVLLDGPDSWANGAYEIDVRSKTKQFYDPKAYSNYWALPSTDLQRWPFVVTHGHVQLSPDHTMLGIYAPDFDSQVTTWPGLNHLVAVPPGGDHMS